LRHSVVINMFKQFKDIKAGKTTLVLYSMSYSMIDIRHNINTVGGEG